MECLEVRGLSLPFPPQPAVQYVQRTHPVSERALGYLWGVEPDATPNATTVSLHPSLPLLPCLALFYTTLVAVEGAPARPVHPGTTPNALPATAAGKRATTTCWPTVDPRNFLLMFLGCTITL